MRHLFSILAVLCLVMPVSAQTTNLVASNLRNGKLPLTGYLVLTPVLNGVPTAYSENGGALILPKPQVYQVTNGVLNQPVDDVAYAAPKICFSAELELANGSPVYHLGLVCHTGTTYSLDGFSGSGTAPVPPPIVQFVPADPSGDCGSVAALGYIRRTISSAVERITLGFSFPPEEAPELCLLRPAIYLEPGRPSPS